MSVPALYATENIPFKEKVIHQLWEILHCGFYWLVAETDEAGRIAFGYANLNNEDNAEWGYVDLLEVRDNGGRPAPGWTPKKFPEAKREAERRKIPFLILARLSGQM